MPDIVDLDGSPPRVAIERVVPAVSSPGHHAATYEPPDKAADEPEAFEAPPVDPAIIDPGFTPSRPDFELAIVVTAVISVALGDVGLGVTCGVCLVAASVFRRLPFSFGQGFIGYRSDMGWPQGVQEDDDFHWSWKARK